MQSLEPGSCRPSFVVLTNIPTPYRTYFFDLLSDALGNRGWELEVWYMARTEKGRFWRLDSSTFRHKHRLLPGCTVNLGRSHWHFNPTVAIELQRKAPTILLVAGAWHLPTNVLALLLSSRKRTFRLFWSESHLQSSQHSNFFTNVLRRALLSPYAAFVCPGQRAADYIKHFVRHPRIIELPNTVDSSAFAAEVLSRRESKSHIKFHLDIHEKRRVLLIPARLISEKGVLPFLQSVHFLPERQRSAITILVAGDGPLRPTLAAWCEAHAELDVRLLGHLEQDRLLDLYAMADGFALPSLSDPNPLAVVEALWAELPLLLSTRVGNVPETLSVGVNGWSFDTQDTLSIQRVVAEWAGRSPLELSVLGRASGQIARRFQIHAVIERFLEQLHAVRAI
jgi:glycosyltransferase involved in cell wall biosynthesis